MDVRCCHHFMPTLPQLINFYHLNAHYFSSRSKKTPQCIVVESTRILMYSTAYRWDHALLRLRVMVSLDQTPQIRDRICTICKKKKGDRGDPAVSAIILARSDAPACLAAQCS
jgi:hypothetical protein